MWRRLNRDDLVGVNPLLGKEERSRPLYWRVYEHYELLPTDDSEYDFVQAANNGYEDGPQWIDAYDPLTETPYLFLEFARIEEDENPTQALMQWIEKYGLLGFTQLHPTYSEEQTPRAKWINSIFPVERYDDRGGPKDTLDLYFAEVEQTNDALRLYEAALGRDKDKLETVLEVNGRGSQAGNELRSQHLQVRAAAAGANWIDVLVDAALWQVLEFITYETRAFVFPEPAVPSRYAEDDDNEGALLTVDKLTQGWGVRNLLGALHLQFYWFVTSAGQLSRCKQCGRIIPHASSIPEAGGHNARKPRKDKEFCDSRCRQNYHYQHRIKPTRRKK